MGATRCSRKRTKKTSRSKNLTLSLTLTSASSTGRLLWVGIFVMRKSTMWFPNTSDTNTSDTLQKNARSLKFWIYVEEELYYLCSENKGADQLRSHCEANLRLWFRICRLLVSSEAVHIFPGRCFKNACWQI